MCDFGNNLTQKCVLTRICKENEAHQLFSQVCAKNFFPEQIPAELTFYSLKILSIVQKAPPLPNGSLVEDRCHSLKKPIVKIGASNDNALLLSFPDLVSGLSFNLFLPPKIVTLYRKDGHGIEFHLIAVSRLYIGHPLRKGQNIRTVCALPKRIGENFRIPCIVAPLLFEPRDPR